MPEHRPADVGRRFRRRLRLVAVALVAGWIVVVGLMGVAVGYWGTDGTVADGEEEGRPHGVVLIGAVTVAAGAAVALGYRSISRPVGDLLGAAERVATGDYEVDVTVRGFRELRLLTETFNEMAARLAANEEQRRRFLADITHELRNPLAVLQSRIEAQMDGVHPRDDQHLASLLRETRRLGHLVDDLVGRHEAQAGQRDVAVRPVVASGLPLVRVDPSRIRQVLDNLLANAIRHTPAGGEVLVEVGPLAGPGPDDDPMVRCRVTDAGPGFRDDQLAEVFERFTRAGDSRGSGLGLSIARDLVQAHGGIISAANDPTTNGATVTFTLPT